jgi:sigma-B regulation protein RsbU (phosphoserine phosphatase)
MTDQNARILIVDDVAENRDLLIRRLQRLGFKALDQAENGIEALKAIGANAYDLVLLDIMMPELDGFGVLEMLNKDGRINELPVIVISALNEIEPVVRCIELGADDFLFKPFNPTLLRARVLATLEKKALRDRTREELRRKQMELNEARTLQLSLVPKPFAGETAGRKLAIDVVLEPAKEVGGDLVDHFFIDEDLLVLLLGDVSDKGAGAALVMARTHAMFGALSGRPDALELFRDPARAVGLVNTALANANESCMFVTLVLATIDLNTGQLNYVRAGHIPPYHRNAEGKITRLNVLSGPPLGLNEMAVFKTGSITLSPGDGLLVVTDGFTEAQSPTGELYGDARVESFFTQATSNPASLKQLLGEIRSFEAGQPASDDCAAVQLAWGVTRLDVVTLATPEAIAGMTDRILHFLKTHGVQARTTHHVAMLVEEILTNLGTHGNCAEHPAKVGITVEPTQVLVEIVDTGPSFDPREAPQPDLDLPAGERPIGGLGLHLLRQLSHALEYVHRDAENYTTFGVART